MSNLLNNSNTNNANNFSNNYQNPNKNYGQRINFTEQSNEVYPNNIPISANQLKNYNYYNDDRFRNFNYNNTENGYPYDDRSKNLYLDENINNENRIKNRRYLYKSMDINKNILPNLNSNTNNNMNPLRANFENFDSYNFKKFRGVGENIINESPISRLNE